VSAIYWSFGMARMHWQYINTILIKTEHVSSYVEPSVQ